MRGQQDGPDDRGDYRRDDDRESESVLPRFAHRRRGGDHTVHHPPRGSGIPPNSSDSRENPEPLRERCATIARVPKRVLIVDDHEPFRAVARELLEDAGYIVAGEAADAAEALAAVAAGADGDVKIHAAGDGRHARVEDDDLGIASGRLRKAVDVLRWIERGASFVDEQAVIPAASELGLPVLLWHELHPVMEY